MKFFEYVVVGVLLSLMCSFVLPLLRELIIWILGIGNMSWLNSWSVIYSVIIYFSGSAHSTTSGELKKAVGTFWHLTDLHVDREYSRAGNPNDLCHESSKRKYDDNGIYGNFLCDSPWTLVNLTIDAMWKIEPEPDFIIWTGDNLPHTRNPHPEWDITFREIADITNSLRQRFPKTPIYPSIGNHDTFPPNLLQPEYSTNDSIYEGYLTKGMWKSLLPETSISSFIHGGYYSVAIKKGLRLISLNTILWYDPNKLTKDLVDPSGQFAWLSNELEHAAVTDEKVYIIGHVPPGFYNRVYPGGTGYQTFHPQYLTSYMQLIKKYYHVIAGQFFAHLHNDMFQIYHYDSGYALSSGLMASSVTPWHSNTSKNVNVSIPVNPSIRLIQYSKVDWILLNYFQYFLNLTEANNQNSQGKHISPDYELLYSFTEAYSVKDLSSASLVEVYEKLKSSPVLFQKFYKYLTSGKESVPCDTSCKSAQLCSMSCSNKEYYVLCMQKVPLTGPGNTTVASIDSSDHNILKSGTLTYSLVIGFICLFILVLATFFIYYCRREPPRQRQNYIHLSSL